MRFKEDPALLSWIGGAVLSKLDGARDMFVQKVKYLRGRGDMLKESFADQVKRVKEEKMSAWRRNGGTDPHKDKAKVEVPDDKLEEVELTRQQELQIEAEANRKVERERGV